MKNQVIRTLAWVLALVILASYPMMAVATGTGQGEAITTSEGATISEKATALLGDADKTIKEKVAEMFPNSESPTDAGLPVVTIDDASDWMEKKGFEIIGFLQKFIQPFAIIVFIFSGMMVLAGSFGNGKSVSQGLWGMFIALMMYVTVLYAPEIMDVFLGWIQS